MRIAVDTPTAFNYALKPLFTDFSENSSLFATISMAKVREAIAVLIEVQKTNVIVIFRIASMSLLM